MQPQDGAGTDWSHWPQWLSAAAGALGLLSGGLAWIFRAGGVRPMIALDIQTAEKKLETKISESEHRIEDKVDLEMDHFRETLTGLREKINLVEKDTVRKIDFESFRSEIRQDNERSRAENREDFAAIRKSLEQLIARHP